MGKDIILEQILVNIRDKTNIRLIDLFLPFMDTDRNFVPYKVSTVFHEFPFMWTKWFACLDVEFWYYVPALQWFLRSSNIFALRRCGRRSRGLHIKKIINKYLLYIEIYTIFTYNIYLVYIPCLYFLAKHFLTHFQELVLTSVINILLTSIGNNIHHFFLHVVSRGSHI